MTILKRVAWTLVRMWIGWQWLQAGMGKVGQPVWTGEQAGVAVAGFLKGALAKAAGDHPEVKSWYAGFVEKIALPNAKVFSYLVAYGEVLVGIALILGALTTVAALMGALMNLNFLLAGVSSSSPVMLVATLLILTVAAAYTRHYSVDRMVIEFVKEKVAYKAAGAQAQKA
ncbi:MAG: DoxX family protein [Firmicutes bacterium]|nr:DoxX family protein [Bacillota bacterium]